MTKLLTRLLGPPEEINGAGRCKTYLYRWFLFGTPGKAFPLKAYLHHFVGNDWSRDLHDHPKRFISVGLWGHYYEETPCSLPEWSNTNGQITIVRKWRAPWIRSFPATHIHRLRATNCWTLIFVLKPVREWGFWHSGRFIHWKEYVYGKDAEIADKMKDCL